MTQSRDVSTPPAPQGASNSAATIAEEAAAALKSDAIVQVRNIFGQLKRVLKQIALYRHMKERYAEYLQPVYESMTRFWIVTGRCLLKWTLWGSN